MNALSKKDILLDTQRTLEHLAYMGYTYHSGEENQLNALIFSQERKVDLAKKQTNRTVYRCHVIGTYIKCRKILKLPKKKRKFKIKLNFF